MTTDAAKPISQISNGKPAECDHGRTPFHHYNRTIVSTGSPAESGTRGKPVKSRRGAAAVIGQTLEQLVPLLPVPSGSQWEGGSRVVRSRKPEDLPVEFCSDASATGIRAGKVPVRLRGPLPLGTPKRASCPARQKGLCHALPSPS